MEKEAVIEKIEYQPKGVCSNNMLIEIEGETIKRVEISGGCPGNTLGVAKLCVGKNINEVIELLHGIPCRNRETSCPDQLAKALIEYKKRNN